MPSRSISTGRAAISVFTTPPACAAARASTEKLEKLSVADALNAVRFAEVVVVLLDVGKRLRGTGPAHRRSGRAGRPRHRDRGQQMGSEGKDRGRHRQVARAGRREAYAAQRRAAGGGLGPDRRRPRPADAGDRRCLRRLEQARSDQRAQSLVRTRDRARIRRRRCRAARCGSTTSRRPRAGRRASWCSARAPMRCPTPTSAIW